MTHRKYAWRPDVPDHRDHAFTTHSAIALPAKVDRLGMGNPIEDQGQLGSCTGNSSTSAAEIVTAWPQPLSRLMAYYEGRKIEGSIGEDSGCQIRDVIKGIRTVGVCAESLYPYDTTRFKDAPTPAALADALAFRPRIASYERLTNLAHVKLALAHGLPVVFGFTVPAYFESAETARTGWVPLPLPHERSLGGHAVVAVGYDDTAGPPFVWVRNSWGSTWGIGGYFKMDQRWFTDKRRLVDDLWVMHPATSGSQA